MGGTSFFQPPTDVILQDCSLPLIPRVRLAGGTMDNRRPISFPTAFSTRSEMFSCSVLVVLLAWKIAHLPDANGLAAANDTKIPTTPVDVKRMMDEQCRKEYSITCLKLDLAALVPGLSVARKYKLLPGLTLEFGGFETKEPGGKLPLEAAEPVLDRYLIKGLDAFMNSIAIRVNVMDKAIADRVNNIGQTFVSGVEKYEDDVGRGRKKKINQALIMGGMISAGTLLALTMSTISAMAGKAILVSLLSLALTLMTNKANGGDGGAGGGSNAKTTYEIITHTMPPHDEYTNRHWAQSFTDGYIVKATPHS